ncbi:glycosyltransferase [Microvirga sp. WGZ8]|uniref:Glycosyltransferase n=1 Tax=Microvirga puerhi TaxID=2876078 RepID=A0ABS7VU58_9HYPH|nr:glycosyltransferase family 2 protein [Microvirga puerhi]MBZ6079112.1 glycosyltransferase [Microvirga puerhi]
MWSQRDGSEQHSSSAQGDFVSLFSRAQKIEAWIGASIWAVALLYFWTWWFQPEHNIGWFGYGLVTVTLAWVTLLPLYFIVIFFNARKPTGPLRLPAGSRVAMVVTKAPSEPFSVVAETLEAMLRQTYPHDTWLADEDPTPTTLRWCRERGVQVSTRKGRLDYHRTSWPRRTRCKEGNLAFFYDRYGYERYDFVAQLDADHVPTETYLEEVLKPFSDPGVGYVSAPSICDKNAAESWSARSRLYVEGTLHGALQAGYNSGWAPLCIGSHYAVRTAALREIGGLGPELAEDHSTTLLMNAHGWRGVHAIDAIAHGDGPRTFADLATQEFQWSRSLMMILLQYSPTYIPRLPARLKFQFIFSQLWYPLFSFFMALMFAMPIAALTLGINFVGVTFPEFVVHFVPISLALIVMAWRWKAGGWSRPVNAKVLSWEGTLFLFARWPWSLAGTVAAVRDTLTGTVVDFRVTPKGSDPVGPLPSRVIMPYIALVVGSALPVLMFSNVDQARGFYVFASVNSAFYAVLLIVILFQHVKDSGVQLNRLPSRTFTYQATAALAVCLVPATAMKLRGAQGIEALSWGKELLSLTEVTYRVAGAAQGGAGVRQVQLRPFSNSQVQF